MIVIGVGIIVDGSIALTVTIENQINVRGPHDSAFQAQGRSLVYPIEDRSLGFAGGVVHEGIDFITHSAQVRLTRSTAAHAFVGCLSE